MLTTGEEPRGGATRRRQAQLRKLTEVSRSLTYTTDIDQVMRLAVDRAAELLGASKAVLLLADEEGQLHVRAAHGIEARRVEKFREPLEETLVRRLRGLFEPEREGSVVAVPLVVRGQVTGILAIDLPGPRQVGDDDEWMLSALADQAAVALEQARLSDEVHIASAHLRELEQSLATKDQAVATLAHDLRGPLTAIELSLASMIRGGADDRQAAALGRIRAALHHMRDVLEHTLEMALARSGLVGIQTEPVPAGPLARQVAELMRAQAESRGQRLVVRVERDATVRADPARLRQVLVNLVENAVRYSPQGGEIRIWVAIEKSDDLPRGAISVIDHGPGIERAELKSIFEPFQRGAAARSAHQGGVGLGLAISRALVERMGGALTVSSRPGSGSTFTVRLPLAR